MGAHSPSPCIQDRPVEGLCESAWKGHALFFMHLARGLAATERTMNESVIGEEGVGIFKAAGRRADAH